jgi:hypothetical protein
MATHERDHLDRALEIFERAYAVLPEDPDATAEIQKARS